MGPPDGPRAAPVRVVVCWSIDHLSRSDTLETVEILSRYDTDFNPFSLKT